MFNIYIEPKVDHNKIKKIHLKLRVSPGGYVEMCAVDENGDYLVPLWCISKTNGKIIAYSNVRNSLMMNNYDVSGMEFQKNGGMCLF